MKSIRLAVTTSAVIAASLAIGQHASSVYERTLKNTSSWLAGAVGASVGVKSGPSGDEASIEGPAHILKDKPYAFAARGVDGKALKWVISPISGLDESVQKRLKDSSNDKESLRFVSSGSYRLSLDVGGKEIAARTITVYDMGTLAFFTKDGSAWDKTLGVGEAIELKVRNTGTNGFGTGLNPPLQITLNGKLAFVDEGGNPSQETNRAVKGGEFFKVMLKGNGEGSLRIAASSDLDATDYKFPDEVKVVPVLPKERLPELSRDALSLRVGQLQSVAASFKVGEDEIASYSWKVIEGKERVSYSGADTAELKVTGLLAGSAKFQVTATLGESHAVRTISVAVLPRARTLQVIPSATQLVPRKIARVDLNLLDDNGAPIQISGQDSGTITVTQSKPDVLKITADPQAKSSFSYLVEGLQQGGSDVTFTLTLDASPTEPISAHQSFQVSNISEFLPIEVSLKQLDEATVRNTFGSAISRDYFVLEVDLINKLRALSNGTRVDSILVYGQSFDVGVDMVKEVRGAGLGKGAKWEPVTFGDVTREFSRAHANSENPYPAELSAQPLGSVLIDRDNKGENQSLAGSWSRTITLAKGDRFAIRLAQLPDVKITCVAEDCNVVEVISGQILKAKESGDSAVTVTICYTDGAQSKQATATFNVQVVDDKGAFLNNWITSGKFDPVLLSTTRTYVLTPPPSMGSLVELDLKSSPAVDLDPKTGVLRSVLPGDVLITASSKDGKVSSYLPLRFVAPSTGLVLPPSVFEGPDGPVQIKAALRYKPVSQELVLLSQDRRESTSPQGTTRSLIDFGFKILGWTFAQQAIGSMKPSLFQDDIWPGVLALGPQLSSRFLPDNSSAHRNAILTQGMKEVEAIPFGGHITKVVFFPRSVLSGYLRYNKVRIAAVDSTSFRIAVGAVTSIDQVDQRNVIPPGGNQGQGSGQGGGE